VTTEVPEGDRLGFVILQRAPAGDGASSVEGPPLEVMLQSRASVGADVPALAEEIFFRSPDGTLVGLAAFEEEEG